MRRVRRAGNFSFGLAPAQQPAGAIDGDIDRGVLEKLIAKSLASTRRRIAAK